MLSAFAKAVAQLDDPAIRRVLWLGLGAALLVFALVWLGAGYLIARLPSLAIGWLDALIGFLGGAAVLIVTWFLFPGVISAVSALLLEGVADAVEARHYPSLPKTAGQSLVSSLASSLRFLGAIVGLNLLLLPFLLLPPVFPFVFYSVNGYLLGREYFEIVALRRLEPGAARALRKAHGARVFATGAAVAFLLTVPLINLLAPVVATAAMVHLFHAWHAGR
jgi:uncharacterized protein involved in cysteine biosynthesis